MYVSQAEQVYFVVLFPGIDLMFFHIHPVWF